MPRNAGQQIDFRARRQFKAQVACGNAYRAVDTQGKRRDSKGFRVQPQRQVVHDRITDDDGFIYVAALDADLSRGPTRQFVERRAHRLGHLVGTPILVHGVGNAAHEVFAETDLRIHGRRRRRHAAVRQIDQMRRQGGRADVYRQPEGPIRETGTHADDPGPVTNRSRDRPTPRTQGRRTFRQDGGIGRQPVEAPGVGERRDQSLRVTAWDLQVRFGDIHDMQTKHRVQFDGACLGPLAHDLTMHLTFGRHVDDEIAQYPGMAGQPAAQLQALALGICGFRGVFRRQVAGRGANAVFREIALSDLDLAASAKTAPSAHRIEIDPQHAGRIQNRCVQRDPATMAGRRKDDKRVGGGPFFRRRFSARYFSCH